MYHGKNSTNEASCAGMRKFPYKIRLLEYTETVYAGAGVEYVVIGSVSERNQPEIVEERTGKGAERWGRLKSGAGWIMLDRTEIIPG